MQIQWRTDYDAVLMEASRDGKAVLLDFSAAPTCHDCARLDADVYADERVIGLIEEKLIPARVHLKDNAADFHTLGERYDAQGTPTVLLLDRNATERHRFEDFLPADFLAQLEFAVARIAFNDGRYAEARQRYAAIAWALAQRRVGHVPTYWTAASATKASIRAG